MTKRAQRCSECNAPLSCPACAGAIGGASTSKAKRRAARRNAKLAGRPRKYPKCRLYGSHRFRNDACPCGFDRDEASKLVPGDL